MANPQHKGKLGSQFPRDPSNHPFVSAAWPFFTEKVVPTAFAGGTTNARGDDGGTSDPFTLFTVTGDVIAIVYGVCTVDLVSAGGGTLEVGVSANTASLIALTTATAIDVNEVWYNATPVVGAIPIAGAVAWDGGASSEITPKLIVNSLDIIETTATADITAGNIYYLCGWYPLSSDGAVEAAV